MSDGKKYYCFCGSNCKYETMTKEQILAAITQAASGEQVIDPDAGFITKVKELNSGKHVTFWVGTRAQYNELKNIETNCVYIISDDTTSEDLLATVEQMAQNCENSAAAAISASNEAKMLSSHLPASAYKNGICADMLDIDFGDPKSEKNLPFATNGKTVNLPPSCTYGMRIVFYLNRYNIMVMWVGGNDTNTPEIWLNHTNGAGWSGWTKMG